jgi:hypothetical protein
MGYHEREWAEEAVEVLYHHKGKPYFGRIVAQRRRLR